MESVVKLLENRIGVAPHDDTSSFFPDLADHISLYLEEFFIEGFVVKIKQTLRKSKIDRDFLIPFYQALHIYVGQTRRLQDDLFIIIFIVQFFRDGFSDLAAARAKFTADRNDLFHGRVHLSYMIS